MNKDLDRMPTEFEVAQYEQKVQAYSWSFQQDFVTFMRSLHVKGIDINWAIKCILVKQKTIIFDRKERARAIAEWRQKGRKCPDCGSVMHILRVNDRPGTMVGRGYQSQWICPNQPIQGMSKEQLQHTCGFTEFSKRSVEEWFKKLRVSPDRLKKARHPFMHTPMTDFVAQVTNPDLNPELKEEGDQNAD